MKINDLTDKQLHKIVVENTTWVCYNRPDWMIGYYPKVICKHLPCWMIVHYPEVMCYHNSDWVLRTYPDIICNHRPSWVTDHYPEVMEKHGTWKDEDVPEDILKILEKE